MSKYHIEDNELLSLASGVLENIMPIFVKDSSDTPSGQLKNLINVVSTHFESFKKSVEVKVYNEFDAKRFNRLKGMIANDRILLDTCVKSIPYALSKGGSVYKSCFPLSKFTEDIEK